MIRPRTLKGFHDALPPRALRLERTVDRIRSALHLHGYRPIRTPVLEFEEILRGKGGAESDRQMYTFTDHGGRRVGLRFDLTIPLARFVSQHGADLALPLNVYQWGAVWRGENTQRGRSREFVQFDFDVLGADSAMADAVTLTAAYDALTAARAPAFTIRVSSRALLAGVLRNTGVPEDRTATAMRAIDKLGKIGADGVGAELRATGADASTVDRVLAVVGIAGRPDHVVARLDDAGVWDAVETSATRLFEVVSLVGAAGVPPHACVVDLSIARGLDYYTGLVFETTLRELGGIGSVCSGGRYDHLTELFSDGTPVRGVGGSVGVDRLLDAMESLGTGLPIATPAFALLTTMPGVPPHRYVALATTARSAGVQVEIYPDTARLGHQLRFADRVGHQVAVIVGPDELAENVCQIRRLSDRTSTAVAIDDLATELARLQQEAARRPSTGGPKAADPG